MSGVEILLVVLAALFSGAFSLALFYAIRGE